MGKKSKLSDVHQYLDNIGEEHICDQLIEGRSLRAIAKELRASPSSVLRWIDRDPGRMRQYQLARQAQADALVDGLIELADEPVPLGPDGRMDSAAVNDKRLRIDTRKWIASKFHPKLYGDRVDVSATVSGTDRKPEEVMAQIAALLAAHGLRVTSADEQAAGLGEVC